MRGVLWTDLRVLVVDTGRLWWRILPQLLSLYLLGWLGTRVMQTIALVLGDVSGWLALAFFTLGILSELIAVVLILRLAGRELGTRALIPEDEIVHDDREAGVTNLLAVTMLPLLGLYAAFGKINEAAIDLYNQQAVRYGVFGSDQYVQGQLNDLAVAHPWRLLLIVVSLYVVRRLLDVAHERTGWRPLGFLVTALEAFFVLFVIVGAVRLWQTGQLWLESRALMGWLA